MKQHYLPFRVNYISSSKFESGESSPKIRCQRKEKYSNYLSLL